MDTVKLLIASSAALLCMTGALAADGDTNATSSVESSSVETLKSKLRGTRGFEVDNVHMTDAGVACITYRFSNDMGGESRAQAVVRGDEVVRSTMGKRFEKAWNTQCAASGRDSAGK